MWRGARIIWMSSWMEGVVDGGYGERGGRWIGELTIR